MRSLWILASALGKTCFHTGYREVHVSLIIITDSGAGLAEDLLSSMALASSRLTQLPLALHLDDVDNFAGERQNAYKSAFESM